MEAETLTCDLFVVGTGMAGMSAALFAAAQGLSVAAAGRTGEVIFASGLIDLMGVYPAEEKKQWENPWAAMAALRRGQPDHPYAKLTEDDVRDAMEGFFHFMEEAGLRYYRRADRNCRIPTPAGTTKMTYGVPMTMAGGVEAMEQREPCLLLDIQGLRGFSARQMVSVLSARWPGIQAGSVAFPGVRTGQDLFTEPMARALESSDVRQAFARKIAAAAGGVSLVGLPAMFGIQKVEDVKRDLEEQAGVRLFEIPVMPPAAPGIRIREAFLGRLPGIGIQLFPQHRVIRMEETARKRFRLFVGKTAEEELVVDAGGVVLATGRFLGGGLQADRERIRETLLHLPVRQPASRKAWHRKNFLDSRGHPANAAGLVVDDHFRPLGSAGGPAFEHLHAAGSILADQDWMRTKCGSGLSIATGYGAVKSFLRLAG